MAKKNEQTKAEKEIRKKSKKIKEKIMNKVEDKMENEQIKDLEMDQKTEQIIESEIAEKQPENISNEPISDVGTDELVSVLKIPMADANVEHEMPDVHSAVFDGQEEEEDDDEIETENLNDKYFGSSDEEEDFDSTFFEDEKLMAEMGVEIIDLGMQTLAMGIAQDFDNPEKYAVSDYKKNKIKKPLELLLRKRGAKVSPEVMFGVVLLVVYAPTMILAVQERKEKMKAKKQPKPDIADQIPEHIQEVRRVRPSNNGQPPMPQVSRPSAEPMVIPAEPPKKKGRPKGSKDTKKRSTKGYKGNKNAK
jgi:hypothetical protein